MPSGSPLSKFLSQTSTSNGKEEKNNGAFSFVFFSINDTINNCPLFLSDVNAVAADAGSNTVISMAVLLRRQTTNSVATVSGLCPLLHQQEFPSRPHGIAIGLDDAVFEMYDTAPYRSVQAQGSPPIPNGTPGATRNGDPWLAPRFPARCES